MAHGRDDRFADRWRSRPLIPASLAIHAAATGLVGWHPALWPWALGLVISNHAVLAATGLWPRSTWLGPNWSRLPAAASDRNGRVAITIDDLPRGGDTAQDAGRDFDAIRTMTVDNPARILTLSGVD